MKKRIAGGIAVICLTAAALVGCAVRGDSNAPQDQSYRITSTTVAIPDGRHVVCVFGFEGGVDCDWDNSK